MTLLEVSGFAVEDSSLLGCDSVAGWPVPMFSRITVPST